MSERDTNPRSALKVNPGVEQPSVINPDAIRQHARRKPAIPGENEFLAGILEGNRTILGKAITLIESNLPAHQQLAQQIIEKCLPHRCKSFRVGITGVPGVGKSTFIEAIGTHLIGKGHKLAVLAIDPSSRKSKGSILGDKTRMEQLSANANAFIRPSPSGGTLGGVARKTRETIVLCEAAGYDIIFIETVGVGQSETAVYDMADLFLLLMMAGAGDELQGIKRGIMEMADLVLINKAERDNIPRAQLAKAQLVNALHYFPPTESGWQPRVETCSAITGDGIGEAWEIMTDYLNFAMNKGFFAKKRHDQDQRIMMHSVEELLLDKFYNDPRVMEQIQLLEEGVKLNRFSPYVAAQKLIEAYLSASQSK